MLRVRVRVSAVQSSSSHDATAALPCEDEVVVELCVANPPLRETWRCTTPALSTGATTTTTTSADGDDDDMVVDWSALCHGSDVAQAACVHVYAIGDGDGSVSLSSGLHAAICVLVTHALRRRLRTLLQRQQQQQQQQVDGAVTTTLHRVLRRYCRTQTNNDNNNNNSDNGNVVEVVWSAALLRAVVAAMRRARTATTSPSLRVRGVPLRNTCTLLHRVLSQHVCSVDASSSSSWRHDTLQLTLRLQSCGVRRYSRQDAEVAVRLLTRLHRRHARRAAQCRESGNDALQLSLSLSRSDDKTTANNNDNNNNNNDNNINDNNDRNNASNGKRNGLACAARAASLLAEAIHDYDASARAAQGGVLYVYRHALPQVHSSLAHVHNNNDIDNDNTGSTTAIADAYAAMLRARRCVYTTALDDDDDDDVNSSIEATLSCNDNNNNNNNDSNVARAPHGWWRRVLSPMFVAGADYYNDVLLCLPPLLPTVSSASCTHNSNNDDDDDDGYDNNDDDIDLAMLQHTYATVWRSAELHEARAALWWRRRDGDGDARRGGSRCRCCRVVPAATALHALQYTLRRQLVAAVANAAHATLLLAQQQQQDTSAHAQLVCARALHTRAVACERAASLSLDLVAWHCPWPPPPPVVRLQRRATHADANVTLPAASQQELLWCYQMYAKLCVRAMRLHAAADATGTRAAKTMIATSAAAMRVAHALHDHMRRWRNAREHCQQQQQQQTRTQQGGDAATWSGDVDTRRLVTLLSAASWSTLARDVASALPPHM